MWPEFMVMKDRVKGIKTICFAHNYIQLRFYDENIRRFWFPLWMKWSVNMCGGVLLRVCVSLISSINKLCNFGPKIRISIQNGKWFRFLFSNDIKKKSMPNWAICFPKVLHFANGIGLFIFFYKIDRHLMLRKIEKKKKSIISSKWNEDIKKYKIHRFKKKNKHWFLPKHGTAWNSSRIRVRKKRRKTLL